MSLVPSIVTQVTHGWGYTEIANARLEVPENLFQEQKKVCGLQDPRPVWSQCQCRKDVLSTRRTTEGERRTKSTARISLAGLQHLRDRSCWCVGNHDSDQDMGLGFLDETVQ